MAFKDKLWGIRGHTQWPLNCLNQIKLCPSKNLVKKNGRKILLAHLNQTKICFLVDFFVLVTKIDENVNKHYPPNGCSALNMWSRCS